MTTLERTIRHGLNFSRRQGHIKDVAGGRLVRSSAAQQRRRLGGIDGNPNDTTTTRTSHYIALEPSAGLTRGQAAHSDAQTQEQPFNIMPAIMRRQGAMSEVDINRRSLFMGGDSSLDVPIPAGRASEQLPRRPLPDDFAPGTLGTDTGTLDPSRTASYDHLSTHDSASKQRRFSMLKFRHASDSQLATRARLQARAEAEVEAALNMPRGR